MCAKSITYSVTNTDDAGPGSLRDSLLQANEVATPCRIVFRIDAGPQTIRLLSCLPAIAHSVVFDATSQPGFTGSPLIQINGSAAGPEANGLVIVGGKCAIFGIGIVCFSGWGVVLSGSGQTRLRCNFIGTDVFGGAYLGNESGIHVSSSHNVIGGAFRSDANVISGNHKDGLLITGDGHNVVQGNFIGTDAAGKRAVANGWHGVLVFNSPNNRIGDKAPGTGNVISGNGRWGVRIAGAEARENRMSGNFVGTNASGTCAVPNGRSGVLVYSAPSNIIGGYEDGEGNLISGNSRQGINLDGASLRMDFEGSPLTGVVTGQGDCHGNIVVGNRIGTDVTGTKAMPNGLNGVLIFMAQGNTVGGARPGAGNVISGNAKNGIAVLGANPEGNDWRTYMRWNFGDPPLDLTVPEPLPPDLNARSNVIAGNIVGFDVSGTLPLGNGESGIAINHAPDNIVGGIEPTAANIVAGNTKHGVHVMGETSTGNEIVGNLIGCNASRTNAPGNGIDGVRIHGGSHNKVGGADAYRRNVIVGNKNCDVSVHGEHAADNSGRNFYTLEGQAPLSAAQMKQRIRISKSSPPSNDIA